MSRAAEITGRFKNHRGTARSKLDGSSSVLYDCWECEDGRLDIIEFQSDDLRTVSSQILDADGQRRPFMKSHYRRQKWGIGSN
jgi:hypothetical protein